MRHEDIELLYDEGLENTLLVTRYLEKKQKQKEMLDLLNGIYLSYEKIKTLIDDYYYMKEEKKVVHKAIANQYRNSLIASTLGLCGAYVLGASPKLDFVIYMLNVTAIGGYALCKVNQDEMPGYTLDSKERSLLKKDYLSEENIIVDLLNSYLYVIVDYLPYLNLDKRTFLEELKTIVSGNEKYINSKIEKDEYSSKFNYENIYEMHRELFDGVKPFNDLVEEFKNSYDEIGNDKHKIRKKAKIRTCK